MLLAHFLAGAVTLGFLLAGLFFLRFWRRTGDELFFSFAIAFALLGLAQGAIMLANSYLEERAWAYLPRLVAFALIILAIGRKNRRVR
ncbi:DUF5985 family protein [Rhizorhabdus dicambivorans]|uniref:DUF2306 domain-containing protein n=1 Tax=Rhizorhabdus dicambivorans TaxID=1850238 RepID=A0A2A4FS32_9SPHN|nr:DUF5985 family protein [Rhizorhabdus dicambivorans]ATE65645.1 hypothetical protein CMV14_15560 [Rhizorhabdus dicambivorans]PCE40987.1 hypothetical protein COO09_17470 [Rhizorhabdus dicambivorans]